MPKISICVPTYNRANALRYVLEDLLGQTRRDFELIVSDDASTDDTRAAVAALHDHRLRYFCNDAHLGLYPNFNLCLARARGEYVAIYHDHDAYLPTIVERSAALLDRHSRLSFVHTALLLIDSRYQVVGSDIRALPEIMAGSDMRGYMARCWYSP
ncbi:MAG: glycosyltransferase, partial [Vicinamibacteria bacterium]|nr:glycosyltransferase [Vicinamibacteria bacterium]